MATAETEAPASSESRRQQLLPRAYGRARLPSTLQAHLRCGHETQSSSRARRRPRIDGQAAGNVVSGPPEPQFPTASSRKVSLVRNQEGVCQRRSDQTGPRPILRFEGSEVRGGQFSGRGDAVFVHYRNPPQPQIRPCDQRVAEVNVVDKFPGSDGADYDAKTSPVGGAYVVQIVGRHVCPRPDKNWNFVVAQNQRTPAHDRRRYLLQASHDGREIVTVGGRIKRLI